jgi:DinB family protein
MAQVDQETGHTGRPFVLAEAIAMLKGMPLVIDALLRGLPDDWVTADEGVGTWSPFDVVGHLIHGERTDWMPRVRIILDQGESRPFDRFNRSAQFEESRGKTLTELLDEFATERRRNLDQLVAMQLTDADFDRRGRHPELGIVTLRQLLATWVAHDLDHIMQISRVLGRQYSDDVGPWRAYLRVISGVQG